MAVESEVPSKTQLKKIVEGVSARVDEGVEAVLEDREGRERP